MSARAQSVVVHLVAAVAFVVAIVGTVMTR